MRKIYTYIIIICFFCSCNPNNPKDNKQAIATSDSTSHTSAQWIIFDTDSVPGLHQLAMDSIAKTYAIQIKRFYRDSIVSDKMTSAVAQADKQNAHYFEQLSATWGKDWKIDFDRKVSQLEQELSQHWEGKTCVEQNNESEYQFTTTCTLNNTPLRLAYDLYRIKNLKEDTGKFLLDELVPKDTLIKTGDYPLEVAYTYKSRNHLHVELLFPGGITEVEFKYHPDTKSTEVKTIYSPD